MGRYRSTPDGSFWATDSPFLGRPRFLDWTITSFLVFRAASRALMAEEVVGRVTDPPVLHLGVCQGFLSPKGNVQGGQRCVDPGEGRFVRQSLPELPAQNPAKIDIDLDTGDHVAGCRDVQNGLGHEKPGEGHPVVGRPVQLRVW